MVNVSEPVSLTRALIDQLTIDAMVLADEAESYFAQEGESEVVLLDADARVAFACEAFRVTQLLKQVVAWLTSGEAPRRAAPVLAAGTSVCGSELAHLPPRARALIGATHALRRRALDLHRQAAGRSDGAAVALRQLQSRIAAL